jgi:hypothetical protein
MIAAAAVCVGLGWPWQLWSRLCPNVIAFLLFCFFFLLAQPVAFVCFLALLGTSCAGAVFNIC